MPLSTENPEQVDTTVCNKPNRQGGQKGGFQGGRNFAPKNWGGNANNHNDADGCVAGNRHQGGEGRQGGFQGPPRGGFGQGGFQGQGGKGGFQGDFQGQRGQKQAQVQAETCNDASTTITPA